MRKCKGYWTYDKCKEEALKYKTKTEFQKFGKGSYHSSRNNNWFNEICYHMETNTDTKKEYGYWTYDKCREEALKYKTKTEFKNNSISAYGSSKKHNWYLDITSHMEIRITKEIGYWTYEKCKEEALKYKKRIDFKNNSKTAYALSIRNKWDVFDHIPSRYYNYTENECREEALKYETKTQFNINSGSIFRCSVKNNWLDRICTHMTTGGNRYLRCIYSAEFDNNFVYVGLTYNYEKRIKEHINAKNPKKSSVHEYIIENDKLPIFKKLTDYIDVDKACVLEGEILKSYILNGWNKINKIKCGGVGGSSFNKYN